VFLKENKDIRDNWKTRCARNGNPVSGQTAATATPAANGHANIPAEKAPLKAAAAAVASTDNKARPSR